MREPLFLRQNKDKWREYEDTVFDENNQHTNPDRLADLYVQVTDDLGYARTFYPHSKIVRYLNGLAARTHLLIYQNKKTKGNRFLQFWAEELPLINRSAHKYMFYSLLVFLLAVGGGWLSTIKDTTIAETFLGTDYVEMTIKNIERGDPMGVYKDENSLDMFVRIATNNVNVSFLVFVAGIFFSVGSIFLSMRNGFMVGVFSALLFNHGVLSYSLPVIFIHGTLELSAIVIAGGAGIMLGNSFMFPGTYTRLQSLQQGAKSAVKIMVGLVPVIVIAAFLESYVTRLTEMPMIVKGLIIIISLAYIVWYYLIYPIVIEKEHLNKVETVTEKA
jgi:uncharacterized membrane protein SpoIIM required for sporulation